MGHRGGSFLRLWGHVFEPWRSSRLFAALGRFTVRFRWLIIAGWIVVTVVLAVTLPSLTSVEKNSNTQFLPASEPSVVAQGLANAFNTKRPLETMTFVAATTTGKL